MTDGAISVVLCDDHRIVREGLKQMLADDPHIRVVGEAASGDELIATLTALPLQQGPHVVMLDIALPGHDGLTVLRTLRERWPELPVLMLSTYPEQQYAVRCIQLGAAGYLHKSADPELMIAAVQRAASGECHLSDATAQALAAALSRRAAGRPGAAAAGIAALSHREHQVFRRLIRGDSVTQIGAELGLASNTISTYRARILEKTGARSDVELALLAQQPDAHH